MARPTALLVHALRLASARLRDGAGYRWSHYGMCNCGQLAQVVTGVSPQGLQEAAFGRAGDWGEQGRDYCPESGLPMDEIIGRMCAIGLEQDDFRHLERLTHPDVLRRLPPERRALHHARREDTVLFLETWADVLAERLSELQRAELRRLEMEGSVMAEAAE
ncbi:MAG: hypothetical protein KF901_11875 [Myxococcales bacterium]|nr:hypothetical protein [Myxococcales bacterium]